VGLKKVARKEGFSGNSCRAKTEFVRNDLLCGGAARPSETTGPIRNSYRPASNFGTVGRQKRNKNTKLRKKYCCGGAEESTGGDGDAAATMAHAVKGGDGEEEEDVDAAAALPHAVAPVGAPSLYCCGGEQSVYCYGGAEEP
jgi:hypothetical protein